MSELRLHLHEPREHPRWARIVERVGLPLFQLAAAFLAMGFCQGRDTVVELSVAAIFGAVLAGTGAFYVVFLLVSLVACSIAARRESSGTRPAPRRS